MRYSNGIAFRQALEQRLKTHAGGHEARLMRDRKRVAFDRLLARLAATAPDRWLLKGGFALDLRLAERARTTKDLDIDWVLHGEATHGHWSPTGQHWVTEFSTVIRGYPGKIGYRWISFYNF